MVWRRGRRSSELARPDLVVLFNRGYYFIPYYFGKPHIATFTFNRAGILTDFEYNQEN